MATPSKAPPIATTEPGSLRLQLRHSPGPADVDGAWWPRSRSLHAEAADLVDNFPSSVGRITRLLFSRPDWDDSTVDGRGVRMVRAARGPVKVGSFPTDDTRLMIVSLLSGRRLRLQVIPSATDPAEGGRLLRLALGTTTTDDGGTAESRWDNEVPWT